MTDYDRLLTTEQAAELLGVSPLTMIDWRWRALKKNGKAYGPAFVRISRNVVRYKRADLLAWIDARRATSTVEATYKESRK